MDWSRGFTAKYYAVLLDTDTWQEGERIEITGGSVTKNDSDLRESANIDCDEFENDSERWIRIYLDAYQDDEPSAHEALFTGIACAPRLSIDGIRRSNTLECYSILKPAADKMLPLGWNIVAGTNGAEQIRELLLPTKAPVTVEGVALGIQQTIIAEGGETNLTMIDKILDAMNWRLRIEGDGSIVICPNANETDIVFDEQGNDVIELQVEVERNWFECPNVFRASNEEYTAIARDDDPLSEYSTINRGREIWMEESGVQLTGTETIGEYAKRRLEEEQKVSYKINYDRRFDPEVVTTDMVELHYPSQEISGYFIVKSQSIELSYGARTSEEVELWEAS